MNWLKALWSQHPELISRFRDYLARHSWDPESHRLTDYQTIERLAVLLHSRKVVVIARENRAGGGTPSPRSDIYAPPFPLSERKPRSAAKSNWKTKTWISIELKDTDGNPVAGEPYKIELPDGRIIEGNLDRMGTAGVSGIDPGECKVTFPRRAGPAWNLAGSAAS
ncbi:MAG TPA: hypothetical protein VGL72_11185 [Bryobacteraceae bacterium]